MAKTQLQLALLILALVAVAGEHHELRRKHRPKLEVWRDIRVMPVTPPVIHGEGPHYDEETDSLYFVDIMGNYVNRFDTKTGFTTQVKLPTNVTLVVPVEDCANQFVVGIGRNLSLLTWDGQNGSYTSLEPIVSVERDKPDNRFNDGKADSHGRLWAGTMGKELAVGKVDPYQGTLYKLDECGDTDIVRVISPVSISNGIAWSDDDKTMYYVDSGAYKVVAFDYDVTTGTLSKENRTVFQMDPSGKRGLPDGMTIDNKGHLWIAIFNGHKVVRVDPNTRRVVFEVDIPALRVTSVAWGGPELSQLFVTTSRMGLTEEQLQAQQHAGCVFRVDGLGVRGRPAHPVTRPHC